MAALRQAAQRGRLDAVQGSDGVWRSWRRAIDTYRETKIGGDRGASPRRFDFLVESERCSGLNRCRLSPAALASGFPDRGIVGEHDAARIKRSQSIQPRRISRQRRLDPVHRGSPGHLIRAELRREVMRLPGEHNRPVGLLDDQ